MRSRGLVAFCLLAASVVSAPAHSATVTNAGVNDHGVNIVIVSGQIVSGDFDQFKQVVGPLTGTTAVFLNSPGGLVNEGLAIGATIHERGYITAVGDGDTCASMCGLMWLGGSPRFVAGTSRIGFHAAARLSDGQESGQANALIGAYLDQLGLSIQAVAYLTASAPESIKWLNPADAARIGITYSLLKPTNPEPPRTFAANPTPVPTAPALSPVEQQAQRLVQAYYAAWSQGGADVQGLAAYYSTMVSFYGGTIVREKVMDEKRKFSQRWPVRQYVINPASLFVQCNDGCSVTGVVAWDVNSPERGVHSVGTASFALRIVDGVIVSENGSVLASHADSVEQQQAVLTSGYADGRQARIDYEQWVTGLAEGGYKDGVTFWASHRSDKPHPPSCGGPADWSAGCLAARTRLSLSDVRRATDKNFWWGWNSL